MTALTGVAMVLAACTTVRQDVPRPPSYAIDHPQDTALGRSHAAQLADHPGLSGFHLLPSGQDAFLARVALADAAQQTLDIQYHLVAPDATGTLLMYRALLAAQRGVRVRLLIDDLDVDGRDRDFAALAAHPMVQVRVFNPFARRSAGSVSKLLDYLDDGDRLNRRMHNKLWIADNAAALIGGRNLGDAYFGADTRNSFADLDVFAAGPVVVEASRSFDAFWNSEWAVPIQAFTGTLPDARQAEELMSAMTMRASAFRDSDYARALRATDLRWQVRSGRLALAFAPASVLFDVPGKPAASPAAPEAHVVARLRSTIEAAQRELVLSSPYFVPHERGVQLLCDLARRGVRVRVLTNSLASTDVAVVHAGYARYRPRLLACGVALHELRARPVATGRARTVMSSGLGLHAKAIMVDGRALLIGSMNLDPRSRLSNTEVAVLIDSPLIGAQFSRWFDDATSLEASFRPELTEPGHADAPLVWVGSDDAGQLQRYTREPLASWWQHAAAGLLGALVPEDLL